MESLVLLVFVAGRALLGVLAFRFGHDSRDGIDRPPDDAIWSRSVRAPLASGQRMRRHWARVLEGSRPPPSPRPACVIRVLPS